jgi:tetratricopeptide (TPR) repeat protein
MRALAFIALLAACSSSSSTVTPEKPSWPEDCRGTSDPHACAEDRFWLAFQKSDLAARKQAEANLIHATETGKDAIAHFRLGQLRLGMALENEQTDYVLKYDTMIVGEFEKAMAIDSYRGIIAPWKDAMEIGVAATLNDWERAVALAERAFENVKLNPMGNTLSLSGTTIGFPLSTGVPQRTVALIDVWTCSGADFCTKNTAHAPFARPGLSFHFGEAYARVGNREKALAYFDEALRSPGADVWPYRHIAEDAKKNIDAFMKKFSDRGQDGSAFDIAYANQPYGCLFCHGR